MNNETEPAEGLSEPVRHPKPVRAGDYPFPRERADLSTAAEMLAGKHSTNLPPAEPETT